MKKNLENKIIKQLQKDNIKLSYDIYKQKVYVNDICFTEKNITLQPWFINLVAKCKIIDKKDMLINVIEISQKETFNSNDIKEAEKAEKIAQKSAEKAQKSAEKVQKNAQKSAEKAQKEAEINQKIEDFVNNFDDNILDKIPKNTYVNIIKLSLDKAGLPIRPIIYNRIISKYILNKAIKQREEYEKLGYILTDKGLPDSNIPTNYEIFFNNYFLTTNEWESIEDKSKIKDKGYCYYDEWSEKYQLWMNDRYVDAIPERFRNIVRQYSPLSNVFIVNDLYKDWISFNRQGNYLIEYIKSLKWDGKDRLGLNMDNNEMNDNNNIILTVLDAEQNNLNKKMVNYSLLHACRQILWPTRYNFQHILSLLGDTNCGKTKTVQDLFTFPCGIYYCEGVDIKSNAWTWGSKLNQVVANIWNEKKGINNAANEEIKNFIDIINGQISYQPKNKNEWITKPSHNICIITYNPKQAPFLSDYSVSYEKRYWIIICNQTEQDFIDKFLHTIDENKEQIWAQLYTWVINNQDCVNELNELEVNELKQIQEQNKGITSNEVYEKLNYWLNIKTYISDIIIDIDQVKKFEKSNNEYNGKQLKMISNSAFNDLIKYIGLDNRHKSFIDKNMLSSLGWIKGPKTIDNKSMYVLTKTNIDNPLFLDY